MTPTEIRFAADAMLQSLGTWLRVLGYDCIGRPGSFGRELLEQAAAEDRVFLTRHTHLHDNLPHQLLARAQVFYILAEDLPGQLREVVTKFALETKQFSFTRCVRCNVPLLPSRPTDSTPADVTECWQCPACHQTFWRGSHVTNSLVRLRCWLAPQ